MKKNNPLPPLSPTALAEQKKVVAALKIDLPADWQPSADVIVVTVGSTEDRFLKRMQKDFAEAAPLIQKGKKRAELEAKLSEEKQREAAAKYDEIKQAARDLIIKDPRLRRAKPYKLAKQLIEKFPQRGWSIRTIQRALSRKKK